MEELDTHQGFDGDAFLLQVHTYSAYCKLGLQVMIDLMNESSDFTHDEPGRVDC